MQLHCTHIYILLKKLSSDIFIYKNTRMIQKYISSHCSFGILYNLRKSCINFEITRGIIVYMHR